jgi:signal peptidase I
VRLSRPATTIGRIVSGERKPWLAALLSLAGTSGLGQLYNGRGWKAAAFALGLPVVAALWFLAALRSGRAGHFFGTLLLLLAAWVMGVVDAFVDARRLGDAPRPWYSRWWALVGAYTLATLVLPAVTIALIRTTIAAYKNPTGSMEPTLLVGDHLLADQTAYGVRFPLVDRPITASRVPERGDLAVFRYPPNPDRSFIKRVIGLPGETVEIRGRVVRVNGQPLEEPYVKFLRDEVESKSDDWGPVTVPPGQVFVLGDNRDNSNDSRHFGAVPVSDFTGKVKLVYFSIDERDDHDRHIRWGRVGLTVR